MAINKRLFGKTSDGKDAYLFTLTNAGGLSVVISNYGGIVTSLIVPDRSGEPADIVLGYDHLEQYMQNNPYFGAIVGRFANRIAGGRFTLAGRQYELIVNNGPNHLHGGVRGFNKVLWDFQTASSPVHDSLRLSYLSPDGQEGYPGNLSCVVVFSLTNEDELKIEYEATTDKTTILNLTHHSYFNLAGHDSPDCLGHELLINADNFTPSDENSIPTGEIRSVKDTALDFTRPVPIGARIGDCFSGYDNNFVLNKAKGKASCSPALAARVFEPGSGRVMEVYTTEPGIQFYTANFLDGSDNGKGAVYNKHAGFCLEAQHFPDSPNKSGFPSVVLEPGQRYTQLTIHRFSAA